MAEGPEEFPQTGEIGKIGNIFKNLQDAGINYYSNESIQTNAILLNKLVRKKQTKSIKTRSIEADGKEPEDGWRITLRLTVESHGAILVTLQIGDGIHRGKSRASTSRRFCIPSDR